MIENFRQNQIIFWINQISQQNINKENSRAGALLLALCTQTNGQAQKILYTNQKNRDFLFLKYISILNLV
jgi:hypothetical protein